MQPSPVLPSVYPLRMVLQGSNPLIWRRLLVHRDTTLAPLHDILQSVFDWSDAHVHAFRVPGKAYGSHGAETRRVRLSEFRRHRGERCPSVYALMAYWACDIRLEAILVRDLKRGSPVCIAGKRAAPPEDCRGAWAYLERLDPHRSHPPIDAMLVAAEAVRVLLETDPHVSVREAIRDRDELREAMDGLAASQPLQPEHVPRRHLHAQLCAWAWARGDQPCRSTDRW